MYALFNAASSGPLRFQRVGGCWNITRDCCDFGVDTQLDALITRLDLIHIHLISSTIRERLTSIRYFPLILGYKFDDDVTALLLFGFFLHLSTQKSNAAPLIPDRPVNKRAGA